LSLNNRESKNNTGQVVFVLPFVLTIGVVCSVPNPGSGAFLTPGSGIRDGEKKFGSGMNISDNFFRELKNSFFDKKMLKFFLMRIRILDLMTLDPK
jgi:hypothetical protein